MREAEPAGRRLAPEWLDHLAPDDPAALRSRADLRRVNALMAHSKIMARLLRQARPEGGQASMLDIGAGDGAFLLSVIRRLGPAWCGSSAVLLDRQRGLAMQRRLDAFRQAGWSARWIVGDARDLDPAEKSFDVITANLALHHFETEALTNLLARAAACCAIFAACEPRRSRLAALGAGMLWSIGANAVTRHDARVSVAAGFRDGELSALWPAHAGWRITESKAGLFSHAFLARRTSSDEV